MSRANVPRAVGELVRSDVDILARLRAISPRRALTWSEVHSVAEQQATALLLLHHVHEPAVPQFVISSLPGIVVERREQWPTSGMSVQADGLWRIVVKSSESRQRQRFTLAHEFKHVIDDPIIERLFRHLPEDQRHDRAERLCNYFAACLLMPRGWIKADWCSGLQDVGALARRYYVSREAMTTRLSELGLTGPTLALPEARGTLNQRGATR